MKKLTPEEHQALTVLSKYPSFVPGDSAQSEMGDRLIGLLKSLVRKGYAVAESSDDGPAFRVTAQGREAVNG